MNVAYDLRFAADHFTGIGTHAFGLIEALVDQPGDERYTVLWNPALGARRFDVAAIARHPRVTWVEHDWHPLWIGDPLRVSAWLRQVKPDVFLSPFYVHPPAAGCPVVLTAHDASALALHGEMSRMGHLLYRAALSGARRARLVLTGSEFSRRELIAFGGLSPDRVRAVLLGVPRRDPAPVDLTRPAGVPDGAFALVIGENRPRKNLALLARTWQLLAKDAANNSANGAANAAASGAASGAASNAVAGGAMPALVSVGRDDSRYPSLEQLARAEQGRTSGQRPVVRSLGWRSEAEVAWLYAHASLVLFPSRYEGFGFPLVEAFAANAPVLAADIPAFRETAQTAAYFAPPDDPRAWADAVMRLGRDAQARDTLTAAGRARAAELTYERTAADTVTVLREAALAKPVRHVSSPLATSHR
jgi:glycosyltransferase involved in cell wall biosynthesis